MGLRQVEFRNGIIEALPVEDGWADAVISNGVINLRADTTRSPWSASRPTSTLATLKPTLDCTRAPTVPSPKTCCRTSDCAGATGTVTGLSRMNHDTNAARPSAMSATMIQAMDRP
jgi:hypothetical protein